MRLDGIDNSFLSNMYSLGVIPYIGHFLSQANNGEVAEHNKDTNLLPCKYNKLNKNKLLIVSS